MQKKDLAIFIVATIFVSLISSVFGVMIGLNLESLRQVPGVNRITGSEIDVNIVNENSAIIDVAEKDSPAVVSVVITQELPTYETTFDDFFGLGRRQQTGTEEQQVGSGSGFIISEDGLIITNRHVVDLEDANYTVVLNDETQLEAEVLGRDPLLDIAVLKVDPKGMDLPVISIGDSDSIKVGQTVIAIGNSLGRFSNTVSSGIVSGLGRSIIASDSNGVNAERLDGVIQTDASINPGNSGGPLLDIQGNVIGVNVAVADAENIGFAIPINLVLPVIDSVQEFGEIRRPVLGVRYQQITPAIAEEFELPVNYGARIITGPNGEPAIAKDSAAAAAGLKAEDIIIEVNGVKLDKNTLQTEIQKYTVNEEISIKFLRDGNENNITVKLKSLNVGE